MKAISLWQPWATLIAIGAKKIETRSWYTPYRGPLLIHAAKRKPQGAELNMTILNALHDAGIARITDLPLGCLLCETELLDVVSSNAFVPDQPERSFGDYSPDRLGWKLKLVTVFGDPIPYRGAQGLFDVPNDVFAEAF